MTKWNVEGVNYFKREAFLTVKSKQAVRRASGMVIKSIDA